MLDFSATLRAPLEEIRHDLYLLRTSEQPLNPKNEASLDVLDRKLGELLGFLAETAPPEFPGSESS